jgi:hypothetical protein
MSTAPTAAANAMSYDVTPSVPARKRSFVTIAGGGALLGAVAGVLVAIPIAAAGGVSVYVATAIDVALGFALIGGLIGANIAGTD